MSNQLTTEKLHETITYMVNHQGNGSAAFWGHDSAQRRIIAEQEEEIARLKETIIRLAIND